MNDWIIHWHDAKKELPEQSGNYLTCNIYGKRSYMTEMVYSSVHRAFNMTDESISDRSIKVNYWAEKPVVEAKDE